MTTDLRAALREAVALVPLDETPVHEIVDAGARRVRRRRDLGVAGAAVVAAAVVAGAVTLGAGDRRDDVPRPADVVHVHLDKAQRVTLPVVTSVRTTWMDPANEIDHDRYEGITDDGLVLRSRFSVAGGLELGLVDPANGRTLWLPPPPRYAENVVDLSVERIALFAPDGRRGRVISFDRRAWAWSDTRIDLDPDIEVHVPPIVRFAPDGRLYVGATLEETSGPIRWWSYAVPAGGRARPEPDLTGVSLAWHDDVRAWADGDGRVVLSRAGGEQIVSTERPDGCATPSDPDLDGFPVQVALAEERPVVSYWCGDDPRPTTVVYDVTGDRDVVVPEAAVLAADAGHVLLGPSTAGPDGVYLLDLATERLTRISAGSHDGQVGLAAGLVLWNLSGPLDDRDTYDVIWKVARVP
jgi:hypothetical protein